MQTQRFKASGRAFAHIAQFHPELTALRRDLHAHPELGFEEHYTAARVQEALAPVAELGLGSDGAQALERALAAVDARMNKAGLSLAA